MHPDQLQHKNMDSENLQFPGVKVLIKETYNILAQLWNIFALITLVFIFPFSLFIFSYLKLLEIVSTKIHSDIETYTLIASHHLNFVLINLGYLFLGFIFTLLSTSAIVYTIACSFTSEDLSFRKVVTAVPGVLKTFTNTKLLFVQEFKLISCILLISCLQSIWNVIVNTRDRFFVLLTSLLVFLYVFVFTLGSIKMFEWHVACITWVLAHIFALPVEQKHINKRKYKLLTKGKIWIGALISAAFQMVVLPTQLCFYWLLAHGEPIGIPGIACFLLLSGFLLFSVVLPTMVYCISVPRNRNGTIRTVYFYGE